MGAGRKTQTTTYDSASRQGGRGPAPQYKKLDRDELGGVIFGATRDTFDECVTNLIFGLPYNHISYVQNIVPGMPLFLFNYSDRKLHGIFEATSEGELHISPHAWCRDGRNETSYPAQVRVKYREKCPPLPEAVFGDAIDENYYSSSHFMFELTHEQAATLCSLFTARNPSRPRTAPPAPPATVASSHATAWAGANPGQGDTAWGNIPVASAWGVAPPASPARTDTASSKPPLPAWQSGPGGLASGSGSASGLGSGLQADGGAAAEAERRRAQSERDRKKAEEDARAAAERQAAAEAKMRAMAAEEAERQKLEAQAERRRAEERAERERQVLEKLKKVSVNGPSMNGASEASSSSSSANGAKAGVNGPSGGVNGAKVSEWELEAEAKSEAEQARLKEERMKLFDGSRPLEAAVKQTVQKNLELCASAISHMRQEALKSKKLAEEMTSGNAQMRELKEVRAENERLAKSQTAMQRRIDDLQSQMDSLRQSVLDLLSGSHVAISPAPAPATPPPQEVYLMGGFNGESWLGSVERFRPSADEWAEVAPMSAKRSYAASAVLDGLAYVFGGGEGQLWYDTVERYDRSANKWTTVSSMNIKRGSLGGAAVQGKIYAVGGGNGVNNFADVEMYDPSADKWLAAPLMLDKRFCVAAAEMNNSLYALGGFDGQQYLTSMERFDPREGYWVRAPQMSSKRGSLSAAVFNNSLYALGGFDGNVFLNTVESYEARMNKWQPVAPMHTQRAYGASMVVDDALYFVGGLDGALHVDSVERYTPEAGWQVVKVKSNSAKRSFLAVAVL